MNKDAHPAQADRTKCKAWCGKRYADEGVPFRRCAIRQREGELMYTTSGPDDAMAKDDDIVYCSAACRDARLPPIAPPAPAPVERRAIAKGQTWRYSGDGHLVTIGDRCQLMATHPDRGYLIGDEEWTADDFRDWYSFVSDAPATSEPVEWDRVIRAAKATSEPGRARCGDELDANCTLAMHEACCERCTPARPAQEAAKAEPCLGCRKVICIGEYLSCREVAPEHREPTGKTTLAESKLPARLPRPRLAHSSQWADECEDAK